MSMIYAFVCDHCGKLSRGLPESWTGKVWYETHYCDAEPCQKVAAESREFKQMANAAARKAIKERT